MTGARPSARIRVQPSRRISSRSVSAPACSPCAPGHRGHAARIFRCGGSFGGSGDPLLLLAVLAFLFGLGVWACGVTGRHLGVPDHGAMCWDEVVAFLLVLALAPQGPWWQAAAFFLFRAFDIVKPPPIRQAEMRCKGGFGVMFDDLLAAGYTLLVLAIVKRVLP